MRDHKPDLFSFRRGNSDSYTFQPSTNGTSSSRRQRRRKQQEEETDEDEEEVQLKRASWSSFPLRYASISSSTGGFAEDRITVRRKSQSNEDLQLQQQRRQLQQREQQQQQQQKQQRYKGKRKQQQGMSKTKEHKHPVVATPTIGCGFFRVLSHSSSSSSTSYSTFTSQTTDSSGKNSISSALEGWEEEEEGSGVGGRGVDGWKTETSSSIHHQHSVHNNLKIPKTSISRATSDFLPTSKYGHQALEDEIGGGGGRGEKNETRRDYNDRKDDRTTSVTRTTSDHYFSASRHDDLHTLEEENMGGSVSAPTFLKGEEGSESFTSPKIIYVHRKTPDVKRRSRKEIVKELETARRTGSLPGDLGPPDEEEMIKKGGEEEKENQKPRVIEEKPKRNMRFMQGYKFFGKTGKLKVSTGKEGERDLEGRREGRKEGEREGRKEGEREGRKEGERQGGKEGEKERGKEGDREGRKKGDREESKEGEKGLEGRRERDRGGLEGRNEGEREGGRKIEVVVEEGKWEEEEVEMETKNIEKRGGRRGERMAIAGRWEVEEGEMEVKHIVRGKRETCRDREVEREQEGRREGMRGERRLREGEEGRPADDIPTLPDSDGKPVSISYQPQRHHSTPQHQYIQAQRHHSTPQHQYTQAQRHHSTPQHQYTQAQRHHNTPQPHQYTQPQPHHSTPQTHQYAQPQRHYTQAQGHHSTPQPQYSQAQHQYTQAHHQRSWPQQLYSQGFPQHHSTPPHPEYISQHHHSPSRQHHSPSQRLECTSQYGHSSQHHQSLAQQQEQRHDILPQHRYIPSSSQQLCHQQRGSPQHCHSSPHHFITHSVEQFYHSFPSHSATQQLQNHNHSNSEQSQHGGRSDFTLNSFITAHLLDSAVNDSEASVNSVFSRSAVNNGEIAVNSECVVRKGGCTVIGDICGPASDLAVNGRESGVNNSQGKDRRAVNGRESGVNNSQGKDRRAVNGSGSTVIESSAYPFRSDDFAVNNSISAPNGRLAFVTTNPDFAQTIPNDHHNNFAPTIPNDHHNNFAPNDRNFAQTDQNFAPTTLSYATNYPDYVNSASNFAVTFNQSFGIIEEEEEEEEGEFMSPAVDSTCFERDMEYHLEEMEEKEEEEEKGEEEEEEKGEEEEEEDEEETQEEEEKREENSEEKLGENGEVYPRGPAATPKKRELRLVLASPPSHRAVQNVQRTRLLRHISEEGEARWSSGEETEVELRSTPSTPRSPKIDLEEVFRQQQEALEEATDDMSTVRQLATRLRLATRRPSYLEWAAQIRERGRVAGEALATHAPTVLEREDDEEGQGKEEEEEEEKRRVNLQKAVDWVKKELVDMRVQDQQLAKQLVRLRLEVQRVRLVHSCTHHQALVEEVMSEAEEAKLAPDLCDLPADLRESFSPVLRDIGVTKMNLTSRRFSLR